MTTLFSTVSTASFQLQDVYIQRPQCIIDMLQVAHGSIIKKVGQDQSHTALLMNKLSMEQAAISDQYTGRPYWESLPLTLSTLYTMLNLDVVMESQISCTECFTLHGPPILKTDPAAKVKCDALRFLRDPKAPKGTPITRRPCGRPLYSDSNLQPCSQFHYYSLRTWLARMLCIPGFEGALDASLSKDSDASRMKDIWDGEMWRSFEHSGNRFTSRSGNLVFGLYCDWFRPYGRSSRPSRSHGVLLLECFNLPPTLRYKQENLFLFGIIPGPDKPETEQINELLKPLVAEFQEFWKGIFFTSTPLHSNGRVIRAALWPLIADLPAIRKVGGFAAHSARNFCAHCALCLSDSHNTDISQWPERLDHQKHAEMWRDASTEEAQKEIFNTYGV